MLKIHFLKELTSNKQNLIDFKLLPADFVSEVEVNNINITSNLGKSLGVLEKKWVGYIDPSIWRLLYFVTLNRIEAKLISVGFEILKSSGAVFFPLSNAGE